MCVYVNTGREHRAPRLAKQRAGWGLTGKTEYGSWEWLAAIADSAKSIMENAASLWPDPPAWWKEEPGEPPPLPEGDITVFGVSRGVGAPPLPDLDDQR